MPGSPGGALRPFLAPRVGDKPVHPIGNTQSHPAHPQSAQVDQRPLLPRTILGEMVARRHSSISFTISNSVVDGFAMDEPVRACHSGFRGFTVPGVRCAIHGRGSSLPGEGCVASKPALRPAEIITPDAPPRTDLSQPRDRTPPFGGLPWSTIHDSRIMIHHPRSLIK
jgi:hypothetical protein